MIIYSFDQLIDFISQHFSFITSPDWCTLLNASIGVYENEKPKSLNEAISLLKAWHQVAKTQEESPLFLN
jgi:hypothetical protein